MYFVCYKLVFHVVAVFLFCLDTQFVRAVKWEKIEATGPISFKLYGSKMISNGTNTFLFGGSETYNNPTDNNLYRLNIETGVSKTMQMA